MFENSLLWLLVCFLQLLGVLVVARVVLCSCFDVLNVFAVLLECFGVRFPKATIVASSVITNRVQWNLRVATIVS